MSDTKTLQKLAGVQFCDVGKVYHFDATGFNDLKQGDFVIVETTRGRQIGQVVTLDSPDEVILPGSVKPVEQIAGGRDMAMQQYWQNKEPEALETCQQIARRLDLPLKVIKAEYSFDGSRLLIQYTADDKVDAQPLRQEANKAFRARVDLRLIGPRDVAKLLGGYGACGEIRCCCRFLTDFSSISIKMAKEQGISLNPQEITGMCGRLRCCLSYEYEHYVEARKRLPRRGKEVGTRYGLGVVIDVLPLKEAVLVRVGEVPHEIALEDILPSEGYQPAIIPEDAAVTEAAEPGARKRRRRKKKTADRPDSSPPRRAEKANSAPPRRAEKTDSAPPARAERAKPASGGSKGGETSQRRRRRKKRNTNRPASTE